MKFLPPFFALILFAVLFANVSAQQQTINREVFTINPQQLQTTFAIPKQTFTHLFKQCSGDEARERYTSYQRTEGQITQVMTRINLDQRLYEAATRLCFDTGIPNVCENADKLRQRVRNNEEKISQLELQQERLLRNCPTVALWLLYENRIAEAKL